MINSKCRPMAHLATFKDLLDYRRIVNMFTNLMRLRLSLAINLLSGFILICAIYQTYVLIDKFVRLVIVRLYYTMPSLPNIYTRISPSSNSYRKGNFWFSTIYLSFWASVLSRLIGGEHRSKQNTRVEFVDLTD